MIYSTTKTTTNIKKKKKKKKYYDIPILFTFFIILNTLTLLDRAIIPGASRTFASFCSIASDASPYIRNNPDYGIGLLQSSFVIGYSIAICLTSHYIANHPTSSTATITPYENSSISSSKRSSLAWKKLVGIGLTIWIFATYTSGLSRSADSYNLLLYSRMITGISEASFHIIAPPMIHDLGGKRKGVWLSLYLTAVPVGLALGYIYGSHLRIGDDRGYYAVLDGGDGEQGGIGWEWAFWYESWFGVFLLLFLIFVIENDFSNTNDDNDDDYSNVCGQDETTPSSSLTSSKSMTTTTTSSTKAMTTKKILQQCLSNKVLLYITLANSTIVATVATLGTFGGSFILALELFDNEQSAAMTFGGMTATAGIIGTPLGGYLVDLTYKKYHQQERFRQNDEDDNKEEGQGCDAMRMKRHNYGVLSHLLPMINLLILISSLFAWPTCILPTIITNTTTTNTNISSAPEETLTITTMSFMTLLFLAWIMLFASQSGITMTIMLSVPSKPQHHRSIAIAFCTLLSHILGDVPAPILLGILKDTVSPSCNIQGNGEFVNLDSCRLEHGGIRFTLGVAYGWMMLGVLFFEIARRVVLRKLDILQEIGGGGFEEGANDDYDEVLYSSALDGMTRVTRNKRRKDYTCCESVLGSCRRLGNGLFEDDSEVEKMLECKEVSV